MKRLLEIQENAWSPSSKTAAAYARRSSSGGESGGGGRGGKKPARSGRAQRGRMEELARPRAPVRGAGGRSGERRREEEEEEEEEGEVGAAAEPFAEDFGAAGDLTVRKEDESFYDDSLFELVDHLHEIED